MPLQDRNAFWNPIMGAVDAVAQDVMKRRDMMRNMAIEQQQRQQQMQDYRTQMAERMKAEQAQTQERTKSEQQQTVLRGKYDMLNSILTSKDYDPETKKMAASELMKLSASPDFSYNPQIAPQMQRGMLHPDVRAAYAPMVDEGALDNLTPDQAEALTKHYFEQQKAQREAEYNQARIGGEKARSGAAQTAASAAMLRAQKYGQYMDRGGNAREKPSRVPDMIKAQIDMLNGRNKEILSILDLDDDAIKERYGLDRAALIKEYQSNVQRAQQFSQQYAMQIQKESGGDIDMEGMDDDREMENLFNQLDEQLKDLRQTMGQ